MHNILKLKLEKFTRAELYFLTAATLISFFWVFTQHLTFTGDSSTYLQYAKWLTFKQGISSIWYLRTPGLPLVLILTGVVTFANFIGFMIFQAAIAVANVWLFYKICSYIQPRLAVAAAWVSILTFVPFIFSTMVMTEHLNLFTHLLLIYALVKFKLQQTTRTIWLIALGNAFLFILKPSNFYLFAITLVFLSVFSQQKWRSVSKFLLIYGTISLLYITGFGLLKLSHPGAEGTGAISKGLRVLLYQPYVDGTLQHSTNAAAQDMLDTVEYYSETIPTKDLLKKPAKELFAPYVDNRDLLFQQIMYQQNGYYYNFITEALVAKYGRKQAGMEVAKLCLQLYAMHPHLLLDLGRAIFSSTSNNYTGQMLFYPLMLKASHIVVQESDKPNSKIKTTNGPATEQLLQHIEDYVYGDRDKWQDMEPREYFADFKHKPQALLQNIMQNPNHSYHWFMWQIIDRAVGPAAASKLFMAAAKEGYIAHPVSMLTFMDDLVAYFVGLDVTYKHGSRIAFLPNPGVGEQTIPLEASAAMEQQIKKPIFDIVPQFWSKAYDTLGVLWLVLKPGVFFLALTGLILSIGTVNWSTNLMIWSIIAYNALIVCVFADPFFRYSALTWLLSLLLALQTVYSWVENRLAGKYRIWYNSEPATERR